MSETPAFRQSVQWAGLFLGPLLALACYALLPTERPAEERLAENAPRASARPSSQPQEDQDPHEAAGLSTAGRVTIAVMAWMAVWWLTEAIEISATALLPVLLFPLLGATTIEQAAAPYGHRLIFLFIGGFMIALSMQRWGLDKRIALLTLRLVGTQPANMVGGFMLATALLSAFVSNTATTAMMLPIAASVISLVRNRPPGESKGSAASQALGGNFAVCLMLGIAYAASIGGVATIIGTPPNTFLIGFIKDNYDVEISFARWMLIGLPVSMVFLPIAWLLLTRVLYPIRVREIQGGKELIQDALRSMGRPSRGEWITLVVFSATAFCWICRPLLVNWTWSIRGQPWHPLAGLDDSVIAMLGALSLFVLPVDVGRREFVLNWHTANNMPWGILILFGGGLSLSSAVKANGVAEFLGSQAKFVEGMPLLVVVLLITTSVILLTELTSNLATTTTLLPILAALAPVLHVHPYFLIVPAALSASCAFMLPVATPPNAIVFGSGHVTMPQMFKAGIWLNLIGIALVTLIGLLVMRLVLGV